MPMRIFLAAAITLAALPAVAGDIYRGNDAVYADAYGNLVIQSRAGFKRILVGKGELADDYAELGIEQPRIAYLEERGERLYLRRSGPRCAGAFVKGRSYMYGLPDGVLPVLTGPCR